MVWSKEREEFAFNSCQKRDLRAILAGLCVACALKLIMVFLKNAVNMYIFKRIKGHRKYTDRN